MVFVEFLSSTIQSSLFIGAIKSSLACQRSLLSRLSGAFAPSPSEVASKRYHEHRLVHSCFVTTNCECQHDYEIFSSLGSDFSQKGLNSREKRFWFWRKQVSKADSFNEAGTKRNLIVCRFASASKWVGAQRRIAQWWCNVLKALVCVGVVSVYIAWERENCWWLISLRM